MSIPCQVLDLCECCQQRPSTMLVHLPMPGPPASGAEPEEIGDFFRICGAACDLSIAAAGVRMAPATTATTGRARFHDPSAGPGYGPQL